jgi:DUF1680 family protein
MLSGVGLDGRSFFYTNAMQVTDGFTHKALEPQRSGWFECSCCPTNILRLLPSLPGYIYAQKDQDLYVNLFVSSKASLTIDGQPLEITQENNYPWDGHLAFLLSPATPQLLTFHLRIPGWARNEAMPSSLYTYTTNNASLPNLKINGQKVTYQLDHGYAVLQRTWKKGDRIELDLPMPVRKVKANANLSEDAGKVAIQRGPLMYCLEWKDNGGKVSDLMFPSSGILTPQKQKGDLGSITILKGQALRHENDNFRSVPVTMIPYYAWANRGPGEMTVWLKLLK